MIKTKLITIKRNLVINKICTKYCHLNNNNISKKNNNNIYNDNHMHYQTIIPITITMSQIIYNNVNR